MRKNTIESERQRLLDELAVCDPATERYKVIEERLNELHEKKSKIDWNGLGQSAIKSFGPFALGYLIIRFEKKGGAFISQASKFIRFS